MLSKEKLTDKLLKKIYLKTKRKSTEKDILRIIEYWLKYHPENIETYIKNAEVIYKRCKDVYEGRKKDLEELNK